MSESLYNKWILGVMFNTLYCYDIRRYKLLHGIKVYHEYYREYTNAFKREYSISPWNY